MDPEEWKHLCAQPMRVRGSTPPGTTPDTRKDLEAEGAVQIIRAAVGQRGFAPSSTANEAPCKWLLYRGLSKIRRHVGALNDCPASYARHSAPRSRPNPTRGARGCAIRARAVRLPANMGRVLHVGRGQRQRKLGSGHDVAVEAWQVASGETLSAIRAAAMCAVPSYTGDAAR
jgi:hypothetical protein